MVSITVTPALKFRPLWLVIGYALVALVVFLSLTSSPVDTGLNFPYEDKLYHVLAYFTLMVWFAQIYHDRLKRNLIALMLVLLGVALEYLQSFDPNRYSEFADMVANSTGVLLGLMLALTGLKNCLLNFEKIIR